MTVDRPQIIGMNAGRPESRLMQEVLRVIAPKRPHALCDERGGKVTTRLADEHSDGATIHQGLQAAERRLLQFQLSRRRCDRGFHLAATVWRPDYPIPADLMNKDNPI